MKLYAKYIDTTAGLIVEIRNRLTVFEWGVFLCTMDARRWAKERLAVKR